VSDEDHRIAIFVDLAFRVEDGLRKRPFCFGPESVAETKATDFARQPNPLSSTGAQKGIESAFKVKKAKTYNRRDSQMVTHSSTSRPVQCLCMAERTGCPVLTDLWSYVLNSVLLSV
jgi:hypothetical protein